MKITAIIPARFDSTRFPGKPLVNIGGISMIRRVYEQAGKARCISNVVVATDDERIREHVLSFGGQVMMTGKFHESGTDRCAEVADKLAADADLIINVQGDEPFIQPGQIDLVASCFSNPEVQIATLVKKIHTTAELFNNNIPKVVLGKNKQALLFSRSEIPFLRGIDKEKWLAGHSFYKHIGIYAYTRKILKEISQLQPSSLEKAEALEQLRWLENGYKIHAEITDFESIAVDHPSDLEKLNIFL